VGIIVRDGDSHVLAARSTTHTLVVDPTMAKTWAALQAVMFFQDLGFYDICSEGDALQIIRDCVMNVSNESRYGHLVEGIKSGMRYFRSASIVYVKREANSAAHGLVREAIIHIVDKIWMEEIPPKIYDIVIKKLVVPMFGP